MIHRVQKVLGILLFAGLFNVPISSAQAIGPRSNVRAIEDQETSSPRETRIEPVIAPEFSPTSVAAWEVGQMPLALKSEPIPPVPVFLYTKAELAQQQAEARTQATKRFIEFVRSHKNQKISFVEKTWTGFSGRIVSVGEREFTLKDDSSKKELTFQYADISRLRLMPSSRENIQETFKYVGMGLLLIPLLPLMLLTGWDGC